MILLSTGRENATRWTLLLFGVALVPYAFLVWRFDWLCDDAFIAFRYSANIAEGLGMRYNPGVEPPVEGCINFLWVMWLAGLARMGLDITILSRICSVSCGVLLLWFLTRFLLGRLGAKRACALCGVLFLAAFPPVAVWSTSGLESMAFALLFFLAYLSLLGRDQRPRALPAGLLLVTLELLRADGLGLGAMLLALALADALLRGKRGHLRPIAVAGAIFAFGVSLHYLGRWVYFGELIPNVARVKLGPSPLVLGQGASYILVLGLTLPSLLVLPFAAGLALRDRRWRQALHALLIVLGICAYIVLVGGDFMAMGRFLLPAVPFLAILLTLALERVAVPLTGLLVVVLAFPAAWDHHLVPASWIRALHFRWNSPPATEHAVWLRERGKAIRWRKLGRALKLHARAGDSIVRGAIGAVGYESGLFVHDRNGLVTRAVARRTPPRGRKRSPGHAKTVWPEFFLPLEPTILRAWIRKNPGGGDRIRRGPPGTYRTEMIPLRRADGTIGEEALIWIRRSRP